MKMLFKKKIYRACEYCKFGTAFSEDQILCPKRGVKPTTGKCGKFSYDPCKRIPKRAKAMDFNKYNDQDYSL